VKSFSLGGKFKAFFCPFREVYESLPSVGVIPISSFFLCIGFSVEAVRRPRSPSLYRKPPAYVDATRLFDNRRLGQSRALSVSLFFSLLPVPEHPHPRPGFPPSVSFSSPFPGLTPSRAVAPLRKLSPSLVFLNPLTVTLTKHFFYYPPGAPFPNCSLVGSSFRASELSLLALKYEVPSSVSVYFSPSPSVLFLLTVVSSPQENPPKDSFEIFPTILITRYSSLYEAFLSPSTPLGVLEEEWGLIVPQDGLAESQSPAARWWKTWKALRPSAGVCDDPLAGLPRYELNYY